MTALLGITGAAVIGALAGALLARYARPSKEDAVVQARHEALRAEFRESLDSNLRLVASQIASVTGQVNEQLSSMAMQMHASTGQINQRMDSAVRVVGEVREGLGELSKATERIFEIGKDISGLQEILRAPKLRGGLGEFLLADILGQCLPSTHFDLQYTFKSGVRCDAVIRLNNGIVPIDSKFPLENFRKTLEARSEEAKKAARRRFIADCKRHIDAIAASYILPEEGTLNFALMYIPAENVYYEAIIKDEDFGDDKLLAGYAFSKRVVPVSPNSFYAYLQTVLLGLRGIEVSQRARNILAHLDGVKNDFDRFVADIEVLGRHLANSRAKYEEVQKKAERLSERISGPPDEDALRVRERVEEG